MRPESARFPKYEQMGAYHWLECDRRSRDYNPPLEARYELVSTQLQKVPKILDVGCGDGFLLSKAVQYCELAVGIDFEEQAVALAKEKLSNYSNCKVALASCYDLPFDTGCVDYVLFSDVFEHLEAPGKCLAEIARVLQRDGAVILTTPKWRPDRHWDIHHVKEYTPDEANRILEQYFSSIEMSYFWPLVWSNLYSTKIGWRLLRHFSRHFFNPFMRESTDPQAFGQIMAVCRQPRTESRP